MSGPLLSVRDLVKTFSLPRGPGGLGARRIRAVDGVSFDLERGETLSLVGESGSGKTTTARCLLGLLEPTSGEVWFDGRQVGGLEGPELRRFRRRAQIVFQDPFGSLNPRMRVGRALAEAIRFHGLDGGPADRGRRVGELLEQVGLAGAGHRFPHELSGGQRQRVGIARALAVEPELIVLDEPVSALDVSVRAQVVNLLADLQERLGLTYLLVAHDLALVRHVSDRVAVMYAGRIVETAPAERLYAGPRHPYTRLLLSAAPRLPGSGRGGPGDRPEAGAAPPAEPGEGPPGEGCPFHPRCPHRLKDAECTASRPPLAPLGPDHLSACVKEKPEG